MDAADRGIQFGAEGLSIPLDSSNPQFAKCRLGTYYAKNKLLPEGGRSLFAAAESWKGAQLVELQVLFWPCILIAPQHATLAITVPSHGT